MSRSQNRLLQLVIAGLLLNSPADVRATIYDDEPVVVRREQLTTGGFYGGASTSYGYYGSGTTTEEYNYGEPEGTGGGGSYGGEAAAEQDNEALCNAISSLVSANCDLKNPPVLTVNGCGSGMSTYLVPDYLMANGALMVGFGPIFAEACNQHDFCYGTYLFSKDECDAILELDMIQIAKEEMSSMQWFLYRFHVRNQAIAYSAALQTPPFLSVAQGAYANAQADGECRAYSKMADEAGCLD